VLLSFVWGAKQLQMAITLHDMTEMLVFTAIARVLDRSSIWKRFRAIE
jgi:hypothetical protein